MCNSKFDFARHFNLRWRQYRWSVGMCNCGYNYHYISLSLMYYLAVQNQSLNPHIYPRWYTKFISIPFQTLHLHNISTTHKKLLDNKIISYCTFLWSDPIVLTTRKNKETLCYRMTTIVFGKNYSFSTSQHLRSCKLWVVIVFSWDCQTVGLWYWFTIYSGFEFGKEILQKKSYWLLSLYSYIHDNDAVFNL